MSKYNDDVMFDTQGPELVEVRVDRDGKVWVDCDGKCRFRAYAAKEVIVTDDRHRYNSNRQGAKPHVKKRK